MIDYDVVVMFEGGAREAIPVAGTNPVWALIAASNRMLLWDGDKQCRVVSLSIVPPHREAQIMAMPRPVLKRKPAA
jgi:hypothetical protein